MQRFVIAVACGWLLAASAVYAQSFPYKACVTAEDVYVRSGPGQSYYATDKLQPGQEVEVYRHDPGGWCAIRPIKGSFTWVSSRYLKPTGKNLAVVTEDNVQARVGSRFNDVRDVVQVRLRKGEVVEILDIGAGDNANDGPWVKIAPPSGEFRWVAGKYLENAPRNADRRPPQAFDPHNPPPGRPGPAAPGPGQPAAPWTRPLSAAEYQKEMERLDLELSAMVTEEPAVWSFHSLRDRANGLLDQAQTAVERGRARALANKIARFEEVKQRYDSVQAMRARTDRSTRALAELTPHPRYQDRQRDDVDDRFDGVGQLTMVRTTKAGMPRYALLNDAGDVRCYITPAPGVNLHNYVGKQVGVTGTRGYMPEQRATHLMARHVTALDGNLLR